MECRGSTLSGVLIGLAVIGGFTITAMLVRPAVIQAGVESGTLIARSPERQGILEAIATVIGASEEVMAIHQRQDGWGGSPYLDIVLRLPIHRDDASSESLQRNEIAVISHSRVLEAVMFYTLSDEADVGAEQATTSLPVLLTRSEVVSREFTAGWRNDPAVAPRVIAAGVSDFRAEWVAPVRDVRSQSSKLRLALTWSPDSADGEDEAAVFVKVPRR